MACRRWSPAKRSAVSSQTLTNLRLIDNVSDTLILRPLISHDKEHIIDWRVDRHGRFRPHHAGILRRDLQEPDREGGEGED